MDEERQVGPFIYLTKEDAEAAAKEEKQAAYLSAYIDGGQSDTLRQIYEKALNDRIFRTPPGLAFLTKLRETLIRSGISVSPIPLYVRFTERFREPTENVRERVKREQKKEKAINGRRISIFLNIVLLLVVGALFYLTLSSPNPNILNYEEAIKNKYASWETELTERERAIRAMERELGIE